MLRVSKKMPQTYFVALSILSVLIVGVVPAGVMVAHASKQ
jgi:hypothetical protein